MRLSHNDLVIVNALEKGMVSAKRLAEMLGRGYTEQVAQSMVLALARKGLVDKTKAALILHDTPMAKFLNYEWGAKCSHKCDLGSKTGEAA